MKPFRERNPVVIGFLCLAVIGAMMLGAFRADKLPLIGGGNSYYAEFSEAGGLKPGDDVRLAGLRIGEVKGIELDGDRVRVELLVDEGVEFGTESAAAIKIKTLLGAMMVTIDPEGSETMEAGDDIPLARTTPPYDVVEAFSDLSTTTAQIDTEQLAEAFDALADVTDNTPKAFKGSIDGIARLSRNMAARDKQLNELFGNVEDISGVLADRNEELVTLFEDTSTLFQALTARREAIHEVLVSTRSIADELETLVDETEADIGPLLADLRDVVKVLEKNEAELDQSLDTLPAFYRGVAGSTGNGPWLDSWVRDLTSLVVPQR